MTTSQNGWSVLWTEAETRKWIIPGANRTMNLRPGPAGYVLAHWTLYFHELIEPLNDNILDEAGWSPRQISGSDEWSNHASATAVDLNWEHHPWAARGTFPALAVTKINAALIGPFQGAIRWGGNYRTTVDEMHFEIVAESGTGAIKDLADGLRETVRGRRLLAAQ